MSNKPIAQLPDPDLLEAIVRAASDERHATVDLLRLLAELDARKLYLGEGCSSLFTYCTQVLHLSEHAAYHRIEAARAARQFPVVLDLLAEGALTLTTLALLRPHLTPANYEAMLTDAGHRTKREVEHQIACLASKPDVTALVRKIATPTVGNGQATPSLPETDPEEAGPPSAPRALLVAAGPRPVVVPTAPDRFLLRITLNANTHAKLRRAQDLLRHTIPNGDPAAIFDRALTLLIDSVERQKFARTERAVPRSRPRATSPSKPRVTGRYIPAAVRRAVWARDDGRCAFEGPHGRCRETGRLEFHHVVPFARGGPTDVNNLALRCRAHNAYEGELTFGPVRTRSGPSPVRPSPSLASPPDRPVLRAGPEATSPARPR